MQFEWDADKAGSNERKHGISFVEGITVFDDAYAITIADPLPSIAEDRYIDIGYSSRGRLLVIVYTQQTARVRIISRRKATNAERMIYERR